MPADSTHAEALLKKVRELPHRPGVYLFKDRLNRVIYVGKARDLRKRVSQYFHPSRGSRSDRKTRALVETIRDLEVHEVRSEPESIILEGKLIKEYRPRYNISFRDDKRFLLVKVNMNDPYPRFQTVRIKKDDGARYFGPFAHSGALRSTLEMMEKHYHLRSCRPRVPGEKDFRHCHDDVIRNCSAPCMGRISREDYQANVEKACRFLAGQETELLEKIRLEMKKAAERKHYEKAAALRDVIDQIKKTTRKQRRFVRDTPDLRLPEEDVGELQAVLELAHQPRHIECFDISNISTMHKVASMVVFRNGKANRYRHRRYRIKSVEGQNDFASMAEVIHRRYARVLKERSAMPDLIVVDGGKGQLNAALKELKALELEDQPIVGLAKKNEEIFLPGRQDPIVLPRTSGALRLLQRVRDEAHRVANGYHQLMMKRRISESVLDEIPGISSRKKQALLSHFGTIEKIRLASVEELTSVVGVGPKLAQSVHEYFQSFQKGPPPVIEAGGASESGDGSVYTLKVPLERRG
jgi:excinuclease ABC subunit C